MINELFWLKQHIVNINNLSDKEKINYVFNNKEIFKLVLDNDRTYIELNNNIKRHLNDLDENLCDNLNNQIDNIYGDHLSNLQGVCNLLDLLNIQYEHW